MELRRPGALFGGLILFMAGAAQAARNPTPPPSGIVVHLFGPGSITSHILPEPAPVSPAPAGGAPANEANQTNQTNQGNQAAPDDAPAAAEMAQGPDLGDVLHQMFVVGDPDVKPGQTLSKGRSGERE